MGQDFFSVHLSASQAGDPIVTKLNLLFATERSCHDFLILLIDKRTWQEGVLLSDLSLLQAGIYSAHKYLIIYICIYLSIYLFIYLSI